MNPLATPRNPGTGWRRAALRGLATLALLVLTTRYWGTAYIELLLPLYQEVLEMLPHGWQSVTTRLVMDGTERMVQARFLTLSGFEFSGVRIPAGGAVTASTLMGHVLQHPVLLLTLWATWPLARWWHRAVALVPALAGLLVVEAVDVPLVLNGAMQDIMLVNLAPERLAGDPYVWAMHVMNTGGRLALTLAMGALAMLSVTAGGSRPLRE